MVTEMPSSGLSSLEQSLVEHVSRGEWLDLAAEGEAVDEAAMRSWGDAQTCRASVIRDILRGRLTPGPDPRGVRLRGARISGRLDAAKEPSIETAKPSRPSLIGAGIRATGASVRSSTTKW